MSLVLLRVSTKFWSIGVLGALALVGLLNLSAARTATSHAAVASSSPVVDAVLASSTTPLPLSDLVRRDPMAFIRLAQERVNRDVRDYTAIFLKQEELQGKLGPLQKIDIRFRSRPVSVFMHWLENPGNARRAVYQDTPEFVDGDGKAVAHVEPEGFIARRLFPKWTEQIASSAAKASSRRLINEFGFKATLDLFEKYNALGLKNGRTLDLRYAGEGKVDGRPTYVIERYLPYTPGGEYPDAKLIVHFDQEWLVPLAVHSYADTEGRKLLGSYVFINVRMNPGLTDEHFKL